MNYLNECKINGVLIMRFLNRVILILLASIIAGVFSSCSLTGATDLMQVNLTRISDEATQSTEVAPIFVPQTDEIIESANASLLAPSDGVIFPGSSGFIWLPNNLGAALTDKEDVLLLPGSQSRIVTQSSATEVTHTIASTTPSLLIAADNVAVIAWVSGASTINSLDVLSASDDPITRDAESPITGLALSSSGDKLAYVSFNGKVEVQRVDDPRVEQTWILPTWLADLSFSPDGNQLAGADLANFTLYFLDAFTGEVVRKLEWLDSVTPALYGVYLSPNWGQAAWVAQNVVQIMDVEDGSIGHQLIHQDVVRSVSWSPDGRLLATGAAALLADSLEPVVMIWDARSGKLLNTLVQQVAVQSVDFSPDGRQLAILDTNGNLQTWSVGP